MKRCEQLSFDLFEGTAFRLQRDEEDREHKRMLRTLKKAAKGELTLRQKQCIFLYYRDEKSVKEIAAQLGIRPPTVSKHLKKAKAHLKRVMRYYFPT